MKLCRFGEVGAEKPGVMTANGEIIDVAGFGQDYDERFFAADGLTRLAAWVAKNGDGAPRVPASTRLGPAVCRPSKIICIGLNYIDHARETGAQPPKEPVVFFKATTALVGPNDNLVLPLGGDKTDWEVELAVVIGKRTKYITAERALDHVAGFVLHNDYSERGFQLDRGGQWVKGKSCDTFAPLGPFVATLDEVPNWASLPMWLKVNGKQMQNGNSSNMIFDVPFVIAYLSQFMTLLPGDVISTGTPAGVGMGMKPPIYLKPGDLVELGIEGLGSSRQRVVAAE